MGSGNLTERQVVAYLQKNPTFFIDNEQLLAELDFAHQQNVISIFHRQIELLREKCAQNNQQLALLVDQANDNEHQLQRFKQLIVSLVVQTSLQQLQAILRQQVSHLFSLQLAELVLFPKVAKAKVSDCQILLDKKTKRKVVICGRLPRRERALISAHLSPSGQQLGSNYLQSVAILKLGNRGYCILGSADDNHFNAELSTLFLELFADVLQALLGRLKLSKAESIG